MRHYRAASAEVEAPVANFMAARGEVAAEFGLAPDMTVAALGEGAVVVASLIQGNGAGF